MKVPYPILKWKDAREKEWVFRALHALGFWRDARGASVDKEWADLHHSHQFDGIGVEVYDDVYLIRFARAHNNLNRTLVNSGPHLISYLKRHRLYPGAPTS